MTNYPGSLHNHTQYSNLRLRDCIIKEKDLNIDLIDNEIRKNLNNFIHYNDRNKVEHEDYLKLFIKEIKNEVQ